MNDEFPLIVIVR